MSDSLQSYELQHVRLPCPWLPPGVCSKSCPLNGWCHQTISSSVTPLSSCPQSLPASGSFPVSWLIASGGQRILTSALVSVLPVNIQGPFHLGLTGLISLQSKGLSRVCSRTIWKHQIFSTQAFSMVQLSHLYMTTGKTIALTRQTFDKLMSLFSNTLSGFVIVVFFFFSPKSKQLLAVHTAIYYHCLWINCNICLYVS